MYPIPNHTFSLLNLLTYDQYQQLGLYETQLTDKAQVEKLLDMIVCKGPKHEELFIRGLQKATEKEITFGTCRFVRYPDRGIKKENSASTRCHVATC